MIIDNEIVIKLQYLDEEKTILDVAKMRDEFENDLTDWEDSDVD